MIAPLSHTIALIILGLSGYFVIFKYKSRVSRKFKIFLWILSSVVTCFWILYHFVVFHVIGIVWVIRVLTYFHIELTSVFVGIFAALVQDYTNKIKPSKDFFSRHNGAVLTILLILPVHICPILFPIKTVFADQWKDDVCIQTTGETCGPACVATLLEMRGIHKTEKQVSREVFCSARGSEMWQLGRCLQKNGLCVHVVPTSHKPLDLPVPCLASVGLGGKEGISHAIIILDKTRDSFTIIDPLTGRFEWTKEKTWHNYYFHGYLLHIRDK